MHISSIYLVHIIQETRYSRYIYREKPLHLPGVEPQTYLYNVSSAMEHILIS